MLPVTVGRSFDTLYAFGFVDDVMFSRIPNKSKRAASYVSSSPPDGGTGAKSAVSDCILLPTPAAVAGIGF